MPDGATGRLSLLRRNRSFSLLFWATAGSAVGTYLAALALSVHIYDLTGSGRWLAALLIADFLPIVVIGLTLGPLVDRLSRRRLMVASDLVRAATFAALPFVDHAPVIVALAAVNGIATGFFRPAVWAGLPNLVTDDDREQATSLLTTVENVAWTIGPAVAGLLLAARGQDVAYWVNAVTFLASALLVMRIPAHALRSDEPITKGHWSDLREGLGLVVGSRPLVTVLVVWSTAAVATACVNVAEVVLAKHDLDAGNIGLGFLVSATGVGLVIGSFFAASALGALGMTRVYGGALALMGAGFGLASASPTIVVAALLAGLATIGNGAAIVCNQVLRPAGGSGRHAGAGAVPPDVHVLRRPRHLDGRRGAARRLRGSTGRLGRRRLRVSRRSRDGGRADEPHPGEGAADVPAEEPPAGLERIRVLMDEIEETRRREQQRA